MERPFDRTEMSELLGRLEYRGQLAFGISCAERLYPNYLAFCEEQRWGNAKALRRALDLGWQSLAGQPVARPDIAQLYQEIETVIPDADDFRTRLVSSAMDAAISARLLLQFIDRGHLEDIVEIASLCRDTVDIYISASEPIHSLLEEQILAHPVMQEELKRQRDDARELLNISMCQEAVDAFKKRWRCPPRSNIGLTG